MIYDQAGAITSRGGHINMDDIKAELRAKTQK